jgi:hypothetical protein
MNNLLVKPSLILFLVYFSFGITVSSKAEPYMAVRGGYKCGQCHINRTGGGMRTGFGVIYSQTVLPHKYLKLSRTGAFLDGRASDKITFGGNLRLSNKTVLRVDKPRGDSQVDNSFNLPEGNLYIKFDVIQDVLSFYIDETFLPSGARNREAYALIQNLPLNSYIKAGRMLLPFGFRILDDDAFIRQKTGFNYANQDIGVEMGLEPGPLSLVAAITNGTQGASENNVQKQISFVGSTVFRNFRIGGSFSRNRISAEPTDQITTMFGAFAALYSGRFILIGEVDMIQPRKKDETLEEKEAREKFGDQLAIYSSLNILIIKGVNFRMAYDYFDPRTKWDEDERIRFTFGPEIFPVQFVQVSAYYRLLDSIPQKPREKEDQLIFELHVFF